MKILGVTCGSFHDSAAALVCDGVLVAAAEQERFSRRKHDGAPPIEAIEYCLREGGLSMAQIDAIAFADKPYRTGRDSYAAELDWRAIKWMVGNGTASYRSLLNKLLLEGQRVLGLSQPNAGMCSGFVTALRSMRRAFGRLPQLHFYDHHQCHASAAYFTSGHGKAAIVTMDGGGGPYATATWLAQQLAIRRLRAELIPNALGLFYDDCTQYAGLGAFGEGKLMGLAAYGERSRLSAKVGQLLDTSVHDWYRYRARPSLDILGFANREHGAALEPPFPDFASAAQAHLERAVHRVVASALHESGQRHVCMAGGVAFNCSANGALLRNGVAASIWVFPAAGDGGLGVGAALRCAAANGELRAGRLATAFWGPEFSSTQYEAALKAEPRVEYRLSSNIFEEVAERLDSGDVVGWFQGRMELGPRALGNRSILADPRKKEIGDRVNRIKGREFWRPLAPAVMAEHATDYFSIDCETPFMLFAVSVRPESRASVPAIVHVDGTARPQTVTAGQNPRLYELLRQFHRRTRIPLLLNTSFNDASEPIVCTPADAIRTFLNTGLDVLVLGDFIVRPRHNVALPKSAVEAARG